MSTNGEINTTGKHLFSVPNHNTGQKFLKQLRKFKNKGFGLRVQGMTFDNKRTSIGDAEWFAVDIRNSKFHDEIKGFVELLKEETAEHRALRDSFDIYHQVCEEYLNDIKKYIPFYLQNMQNLGALCGTREAMKDRERSEIKARKNFVDIIDFAEAKLKTFKERIIESETKRIELKSDNGILKVMNEELAKKLKERNDDYDISLRVREQQRNIMAVKDMALTTWKDKYKKLENKYQSTFRYKWRRFWRKES